MTRDNRNNAMISIVDDDKSVRDATGMLLNSLGYLSATFASAEEFLQSGRVKETACLITDVQMPGMSGFDLQDHLIVSGERTPVIFVTAYPEQRLRERALGAGALGFLTKPFSEESLIACLDKALAPHPSNGSVEPDARRMPDRRPVHTRNLPHGGGGRRGG